MKTLLRKLALVFKRDRFRKELDEEMAFHRGESEKGFESEGMSPRDAHHAAALQFGNAARIREQSHEAVGFRVETLWQDVRYALRQMKRSPGFTLAVVLTLALGIGANTAIFSVVKSTLLRELPYANAASIIAIKDVPLHGVSVGGLVTVPRFYDIAARSKSIQSATLLFFSKSTLIAPNHRPEHVDGTSVGGTFWRIFGTQPMLGRVFDEREDQPHTSQVVVLSFSAWQRIFGGDPNAVGQVVTVDNQQATVIGVMPRQFNYPSGTDMWKPTQFNPANWKAYRGEGVRFANVFALLKPGVTLASAQSELNVINAQLASEHPDTDEPWRFHVTGLRDAMYGDMKPALLLLMAASLCLLLIGGLNVANLLLSRATARRREIALRQALGASRLRIMRQLLTESLLLALFGGSVGLAAAFALVRLVSTKLPGTIASTTVSVDWPVAVFALALSLCSGILFGLAPALESQSRDVNRRLNLGQARTSGASGSRVRSAFIAIQVALSLVLLVCACLLADSMWNLTRSPLGFQPDNVLTFEFQLPYGVPAPQVTGFFTRIQQRVESLPGVVAVGQTSALPTEEWHVLLHYDLDWKPRSPRQDTASAETRNLGGNYLKAMGIPLLAGRYFSEQDENVVLVNQAFANRYLPGGSILGRHLLFAESGEAQIIGVIGNIRGTAGSIAGEIQPEVYFTAHDANKRSFIVRSQLPPQSLVPAIREQIHQVDPHQALGTVRTLDAMIAADTAQPRLNAMLLASFAAIALALACVGIYGVIAYSVAQRRQEIGVRMALGAARNQIAMLFLVRTLTPTGIGLAAGTGITLLVTRLLRSQLYGVEPNNPTVFLLAILLLLIPVFIAALQPAIKAASVDPVEALRAE